MKYYCSSCLLAVAIIENEEPIKACTCEAPIVAEAECSLKGAGGVKI